MCEAELRFYCLFPLVNKPFELCVMYFYNILGVLPNINIVKIFHFCFLQFSYLFMFELTSLKTSRSLTFDIYRKLTLKSIAKIILI